MGDIQWPDRQLYFVGRSFPDLGGGYLRDSSSPLQRLACIGGKVEYDDDAATIAPARIVFKTPDGSRLDVGLRPIAPSICFDIAHSCEEPEHWLYWRTLIEARVVGWDTPPARGWFEASRYGLA
jgi:hypothetical protein